jgi:hypothetical protein
MPFRRSPAADVSAPAWFACRTWAAALIAAGAVIAPAAAQGDSRRADWFGSKPANPQLPLPSRPSPAARSLAGDSWVVAEMQNGHRLAFDRFELVPDMVAFAPDLNREALRQVQASQTFRARLATAQRTSLDRAEIVTTPSGRMDATVTQLGNGKYQVRLSSGLSWAIQELAVLYLRGPENPEDTEELGLFLHSEYDASMGRGRWFWRAQYDWYRGHARRPVVPDRRKQLEFTRVLILHELCHAFHGDVDPPNLIRKGELFQAGRLDDYRALTHDQELRADRCAAEELYLWDNDPSGAFLANLVLGTLHFDEDPDHPDVGARLDHMMDLTDASLDAAIAAGIAPEDIEPYRENARLFSGVTVSRDALAEQVDRYRRGRWPQCPLAPERSDCQ